MTESCPPLSVLELFAESGESEGDIHRHVVDCANCREQVAELRKNATFMARFRAAGVADSRPKADAHKPPPRADPAPEPDLFAGYQILGEIHRGGQGVIYRAIQVRTQRTVAIKMLLSGRSASDRDKERFEREARIAAGLRHPNIVTVYDGGFVADGRYAFAMEYIEGGPLDCWSARLGYDRMREARRRTLRERLTVMAKVCDAVLCAHQHAIVHRDLKPANILVDSAGEPHVLDFGIARDMGPEALTRLTQAGGFAGTLAYASPEQVSGDPSRVDTRTDIYSLGVIMYEMIAGRMPYAVEGSMAATVRNIESAEPAPLSRRTRDSAGPFADSEVSTIILKAMAKDPARRYQTAAGLGNDIHRYLAGEAIEARRDSAWYVLRTFARQKRWLLAGVSVALVAILAGGVAAGYGLLRAKDESQQKELQKARAEAEALAGQTAARLIRQTLLPSDSNDDEQLGRRVRTALERLQRRIEFGTFAGDAREDAAARKLISSVFLTPARQGEAEVLLRQAIAAIHARYGGEHVLLAQAYHDLAAVLEQRGRTIEAELWVRRAIDLRRRPLGPEDPALALSHHLLASLLVERGATAEADEVCAEATRLYASQSAPDPADVAGLSLTRSRIREQQGRLSEAEAAAVEALVIILTSLSDEDRLLPECLRRLAELYDARPAPSVDPRLGEALHAQSSVAAARALSDAAANLTAQGDSADDRRRHTAGLEVVLTLKTEYLGTNHLASVGTLALIGDDCRSIHDNEGELSAIERAIAVLQARLGMQHPALAQLLELVWQWSLRTENLSRAVAVRRQMLAMWEFQPAQAKDELWIANEHRWLATTLALAGEFPEAEREYRTCLDHLSAGGFADHYLGDICTGDLGWVVLHLGRPEEAEALTRSALARFAARAAAPTDQLAYLQQRLGHVLIARGKLAEARPHVEAAFKRLIKQTSFLTCQSWRLMEDAIELAERSGDQAGAERLKTQLADLRRLVLTPRTK